jgi:hypothetical protein
LIGTDKAPEYFFEPSHANKNVIGVLNGHNNVLVRQYSVWAMAENATMTVDDLRLKITDASAQPHNVRRWLYQLIAKTAADAQKYRGLIEEASNDLQISVREGLASSLKDIYFDDLEEITMSWYGHEINAEVKGFLLDHMAANSDKCADYKAAVLNMYRGLGADSAAKLRLRVAAAKTELHTQMVKMDLTLQADLIGFDIVSQTNRGVSVTNNQTINNYGNIGGVSMTGDINLENAVVGNTGDEKLTEILLKLVAEINAASLNQEQRQEVEGLIAAVAKVPNESTFKKLEIFLGRVHLGIWLKGSAIAYLAAHGVSAAF